MIYFGRNPFVDDTSIRQRNKFLKAFTLILLGVSASLLLANADLIINPQVSNPMAYIKQFFVTSDGTNNGTIGVILQSSGVFTKNYCNLSGSACKTVEDLFDMSSQLSGLSNLYLTGGQIDTKISLSSGYFVNYMSGNYYDKTGTDTKYVAISQTGNWNISYAWGDHSLAGYLTGGSVNALATTLSLSCSSGQVVKYTGSGWVCSSVLFSESDPAFQNWYTGSIDISNWNEAYTNSHTHTNITTLNNITDQDLLDWNLSYSWGDHSLAGYLTGGSVNALATTLSLSCSSGQVPKYNGSIWVCSSVLFSESDPKIGTLTNGKRCTTNGTTISCATNAPVITESDPKVGTLTNGKWCTTNGSTISCLTNAPVTTESDPSFQNWYTNSTDVSDWNIAYTNAHTHTNITTLNSITAQNLTNWNTAYAWGDHSLAGYLTQGSWSTDNATSITNWNTAYNFVNKANTSNTLVLNGNNVGIGMTPTTYNLEVNGIAKFVTSVYTPQICDVNGANCVTISSIVGLLASSVPGQMPIKTGTPLALYGQSTCTGGNEGTIRYISSSKQFEGCNGTNWVKFTTTYIAPVIPLAGVCGPQLDQGGQPTCDVGTVSSYVCDTLTDYAEWYCDGVDGGAQSVKCTADGGQCTP